MAVGGIFRAGEAGRVQQGVVGFTAEILGCGASGGAYRGGFRSGREGARAGKRALHALFSGPNLTVSVSASVMPASGDTRTTASLLNLQQQDCGQALE